MAWAIGANDVANAMGTSVGSGSLSIRNAVIIAGILEFCGAFFVGGHVTDTVRKGILDTAAFAGNPDILKFGMLGALAAAATLLVGATRFGLPVSTTHSIVGAIVGFGVVGIGPEVVAWGKVAEILTSWITSPVIGGVLGYGIFQLIRVLILDRENPAKEAKRYAPAFFFVVFFTIGLVTLFKGLKSINLDYGLADAVWRSALVGLFGAGLGALMTRRMNTVEVSGDGRFLQTERVFVILVILTACAVAFAHGSNDVANAIGPLATVINIELGREVAGKAAVAPWMLVGGGIGIVVGLATWGYKVMETVGKKITELTPSRAFAAQLASALTIVFASRMGIPVSTTHILVGSVMGVGLAPGYRRDRLAGRFQHRDLVGCDPAHRGCAFDLLFLLFQGSANSVGLASRRDTPCH
jgi:PiT family inorganic phosphate transporter